MRRSIRAVGLAAAALAVTFGPTRPAAAIPALLVDLGSGEVLYQEQATQPWYPASLTKLMTAYVALSAVREGRLSFDTPLVVSTRAAQMPPSKMGFVPGTQVTLGNALKMMMVKSANDIAVTIAEGVSGSIEAFAEDMNGAAAQLGLRQSHFVNPNGLPDPRHYSSARDMAVIAQALYQGFPDQAALFAIPALSLDGQVIANHNNLIGRYPGIDGMKTGFTCAAGFNVVATSERGGRHLAAVVMGAPNVAQRTMKAAVLFDRGFAGIDTPSGTLATLPSTSTSPPPDMRDSICRARSRAVAEITADINRLQGPLAALGGGDVVPGRAFSFTALSRPAPMSMHMAEVARPALELTPIYVGPSPGYTGPVAQVRPPHSPVGTEMPPETASAYAATLPPVGMAAGLPLKPDINALPLNIDVRRGRAVKAAAAAHEKPAKVAALPAARPDAAPTAATRKTKASARLAKAEATEAAEPAHKATRKRQSARAEADTGTAAARSAKPAPAKLVKAKPSRTKASATAPDADAAEQ